MDLSQITQDEQHEQNERFRELRKIRENLEYSRNARVTALQLAVHWTAQKEAKPADVTDAAERFFDFLTTEK